MILRNLIIIISIFIQSFLTDELHKTLRAIETEEYLNENKTDFLIENFTNTENFSTYDKNLTLSTKYFQNCSDSSKSYGAEFEQNTSGYSFSVSLQSLKKMDIYYGIVVNGFRFLFLNGTETYHGLNDTSDKSISIDMENKEIRSIKINHVYWVNAIQFQIFDQLSKNLTWSPSMESQTNSEDSIIPSQECSAIGEFKIEKIIGFVDSSDEKYGDFIQNLKFALNMTTSPTYQEPSLITESSSTSSTTHQVNDDTKSTQSQKTQSKSQKLANASRGGNSFSSVHFFSLIIVSYFF